MSAFTLSKQDNTLWCFKWQKQNRNNIYDLAPLGKSTFCCEQFGVYKRLLLWDENINSFLLC